MTKPTIPSLAAWLGGLRRTRQDQAPAEAGPAPLGDDVLDQIGSSLQQVGQFTAMIPAIISSSGALADAGKRHLEETQRFREHLGVIFQRQEVIADSSRLVLETSDDYLRVIRQTQTILQELLRSFDSVVDFNEEVAANLGLLSTSAGQLQQVIGVLTGLSLTIRQLSRNAEIMAYHLGSGGQGFAVIAEKMSDLTGGMERTAGQAPAIGQALDGALTAAVANIEQVGSLAGRLRERARRARVRLDEIYGLNHEIVGGFEEVSRDAREQQAIRDRLLQGMATIAELSTSLGVSQEVVTTVLAAEMADAGQIDFVRGQLETLTQLAGQRRDPWLVRELAIQFDLLQSKLAAVRERWQGIHETVSGLARMVQQEEQAPAGILAELEHLFASIDDMARKLGTIRGRLDRTNSLCGELTRDISQAEDDFRSLRRWLEEFNRDSAPLAGQLDQLAAIGKFIKGFAEQIKLLSFYGSVEVADIGDPGEDLHPVVAQARQLSLQADTDAQQIAPLLKQVTLQLQRTQTLVSQNIALVEQNLAGIAAANRSLSSLQESSGQFEAIGRDAANLLGQQRDQRQGLSAASAKFTGTFQAIGLQIEGVSASFDRATRLLADLGQQRIPLFDGLPAVTFTGGGGRLDLPLTSDPITLDPTMRTDSTSNEVVAQVFEGLVQFDKGVNVIPAIAERWTISPDGLVWTFILRRGVQFHNGRELTAADVKYSLERVLDPKVKSPNAMFVEMIVGAAEFAKGAARGVSGIAVSGPLSLVITLKAPFMPFLANLAISVTAILPREEVDRYGSDFTLHPVGTGPFRFRSWQRGQKVELERFDGYYGQRVSLREIHFWIGQTEEQRMEQFLREELDLLEMHHKERTAMAGKGQWRVQQVSSLNVQYVCINVSKQGPFSNRLVRQALNFAIDKQALIDQTDLRGEAVPSRGVFPPGLAAFNTQLTGYGHDPQRAKDLLAQAGFPGGLPGEYLLDTRDLTSQLERAELVRESCARVGIRIKINAMAWRDLLDRAYGGDYLLSFRGWSSDNGDPDNFLYPLFHSRNWGKPGNTAFYSSPAADEMMDRALAMRNPIERLAFYREIEKLIIDDAPWVFLYHSMRHMAVQPWLHGYRARPMGAARLKDCWTEPHRSRLEGNP